MMINLLVLLFKFAILFLLHLLLEVFVQIIDAHEYLVVSDEVQNYGND